MRRSTRGHEAGDPLGSRCKRKRWIKEEKRRRPGVRLSRVLCLVGQAQARSRLACLDGSVSRCGSPSFQSLSACRLQRAAFLVDKGMDGGAVEMGAASMDRGESSAGGEQEETEENVRGEACGKRWRRRCRVCWSQFGGACLKGGVSPKPLSAASNPPSPAARNSSGVLEPLGCTPPGLVILLAGYATQTFVTSARASRQLVQREHASGQAINQPNQANQANPISALRGWLY